METKREINWERIIKQTQDVNILKRKGRIEGKTHENVNRKFVEARY